MGTSLSLTSQPDLLWHLLILFITPFLAYWDTLITGGYVSDDIAFSGPETKPIATYEGKLQRPVSWSNIVKLIRYYLGRIPNPNTNWEADKQPAFTASPHSHHRLNLWLLSGVAGLAYLFLRQLTTPEIAFYTTLLFIVHPVGNQVIAWISGCNYEIGAFFMLLGLNLVLLAQTVGWLSTPIGTLGTLLLFVLCQWAAGEAMFQMAGVLLILAWLHAWPFLIVGSLLSIWQMRHTFHEAVTLRTKVFHEQQMGASTRFHWRKLFVVCKTFYYNLKLSVFPKRLALYSDFFYHYNLPYAEAEDRYFWKGGALLLGCVSLLIWGSPVVQFGVLWFLAFIAIFSGFIVANQMVVDRYVWLPSLGTCLIVAGLCVTTGWMAAYWLIVGLALMRLWAQLPAYENEEQFYRYNLISFPKSEVAYGNLGVVHIQAGWIGEAMEAWVRAIGINPQYDVPYYNLASALRSRGPLNPNYLPRLFQLVPKEVLELALNRDPQRQHLHLAAFFLHKAVTARTCHFPKPWEEELRVMQQELSRPIGVPLPSVPLIRPLLTAALT